MFSQESVILFTRRGCIPAYTGADIPPLGRHPPLGRRPLADIPQAEPPPTATAADGTYPTGMHSCYKSNNVTSSIDLEILYKVQESKLKSVTSSSALFVLNVGPLVNIVTGNEIPSLKIWCLVLVSSWYTLLVNLVHACFTSEEINVLSVLG